MKHSAEARLRSWGTISWAALGLWMLVELLYSSRWWPPEANPLTDLQTRPPTAKESRPRLKTLLAAMTPVRVWMAPYFTYPEPGLLESSARRGVYDTFLAIPAKGSLAMNYGAAKLTPADTVFSLASGQGLGAEWKLARYLGYSSYALDLGAVTQPEAAVALCQSTSQCRLSGDGFALFAVVPAVHSSGTAAGGLSVARQLNDLQRRDPLLPYRSAGPSWGPLVFNLYGWRVASIDPPLPDGSGRRLRLQAQPGREKNWQLYRYALDRYPEGVRNLMRLNPHDVQIVVPLGVDRVDLCIGAENEPCRPVRLNTPLNTLQRGVPIGSLLKPGKVTRIMMRADQGAPPEAPFLELELRLPRTAQELLVVNQSP